MNKVCLIRLSVLKFCDACLVLPEVVQWLQAAAMLLYIASGITGVHAALARALYALHVCGYKF